ncbi:MAG: TonB family protein [Desulfovibrionaceae bacterium]
MIAAKLVQRIEEEKKYPFAARKAGTTGVVSVLVRIAKDGQVVGYEILSTDTDRNLTAGARKTLEALLGERLCEASLPKSLHIEVPIRYELR